MTGIFKERSFENTEGKNVKVQEIDRFKCDSCGKIISFKDRGRDKTWCGIHHGYSEQIDGYAPLDACSGKCFGKVIVTFIKDHPNCAEIEVNIMGIEFAKELSAQLIKNEQA